MTIFHLIFQKFGYFFFWCKIILCIQNQHFKQENLAVLIFISHNINWLPSAWLSFDVSTVNYSDSGWLQANQSLLYHWKTFDTFDSMTLSSMCPSPFPAPHSTPNQPRFPFSLSVGRYQRLCTYINLHRSSLKQRCILTMKSMINIAGASQIKHTGIWGAVPHPPLHPPTHTHPSLTQTLLHT